MRTPTAATRLAVLAAAAVVLAACSSSGGSASGAGATAGGTAEAALSTGPGAPTPAGRPGATPACATGQLGAHQADASVGAGQYYARLVFTNVSRRTCTLTGYPGVSYVTARGVRSGNPATRVRDGHPVAPVILRPGGTASAVLHDSNGIGGYDPGQCRLTPVSGLRVYPPGERTALFIPWRTSHCAGTGIHPLTIGPIRG